MSEETADMKKELARLRRLASDIASEIHDIVEDTLWTDYGKLEGLGKSLAEACETALAYKKEHDL